MVDTNNAKSLELVDSALFCVSVDDHSSFDESNPIPIVQNMLHGDAKGLRNRWFDKSLSLIVGKDGTTGINFEHSWGDGVAVLRYFNETFEEFSKSPVIHPEDVKNAGNEDATDDVFRVGRRDHFGVRTSDLLSRRFQSSTSTKRRETTSRKPFNHINQLSTRCKCT